MQQQDQDLTQYVQQIEREWLRKNPLPPLPPIERPTMHWTELPALTADSSLATEWNHYCSQVGRLLAEGNQGMWVLIKGAAIIGIWETAQDANAERLARYPMQSMLVHQVREREPLVRCGGSYHSWPLCLTSINHQSSRSCIIEPKTTNTFTCGKSV